MGGLGQLDKLAQLADDLLIKLGGTATIDINSYTGTDSVGRPTGEATTTINNIPCEPPQTYSINVVDGSNIQTGDLKTSVAKKQIGDDVIIPTRSYMTITWTDYFTGTVKSQKYMIVSVMPVSSGNAVAMVELQLRSET